MRLQPRLKHFPRFFSKNALQPAFEKPTLKISTFAKGIFENHPFAKETRKKPPFEKGGLGGFEIGQLGGFAIILLALILPGCAPVMLGGAAAGAGVAAIYDRRPAQTILDDQQIQLAARYALEHDPKTQAFAARVDVTSYNYSVLVTGQVEAEAHARRVVERISRLPKVKQVINELTFGAALTFARQTEDMYLSSRAKIALTQIKLPDFNAARVKIVTENGVVYLFGIVRQAEATAAAEAVRYLPGVRRVVKLFEYQ